MGVEGGGEEERRRGQGEGCKYKYLFSPHSTYIYLLGWKGHQLKVLLSQVVVRVMVYSCINVIVARPSWGLEWVVDIISL